MYSLAALLVTLTYVVYEANSWKQHPPLPDWITGGRSIGHGAWGGVRAKFGDAADIFDRDELEYAFGDRDRIGYTFGNRGTADRFFEFLRHATEGHIEGALESGGHSSNDMEGAKKYSYFTQGSGPNGFYSRGYFGSNGYGHEDAKLAAVKDATGGAYRRDFESTDADTGLARSAWSKHSADKERRGFGFDHGARVQDVSEHGKSGRTDGWKSIESGNVSDHRDHHCQQD